MVFFNATLTVVFFGALVHYVSSLRYSYRNNISAFSREILVDSFGFASGGKFSVEIDISTSINLTEPSWHNLSRVYIILMNDAQREGWYDRIYTDAEQKKDPLLCTSPAYRRFEAFYSQNFEAVVDEPGVYTVAILSCGYQNQQLEIDVNAAMLNVDGNGKFTQHLPIQYVMLPYVYMVMSIIYFALSVLWVMECYKLRLLMRKVHWLFTLSVFLKLFSSIIQYFYYNQYQTVGSVSEAFTLVHNFISYYSLASFLFTLLLVSLGWTLTRSHLRAKEARWLALVVVFYVMMATLLGSCGSSQDSSICRAYLLAEYIVRSMIMLFIIVAVNFNIHHIRMNLTDSPWNASLVSLYCKLVDYTAFRWTFIAYLLLPTILLLIKLLILSWQYDWMESFLNEFFLLLIFVHTGVTFGPFDERFLTRAFDGSFNETQAFA